MLALLASCFLVAAGRAQDEVLTSLCGSRVCLECHVAKGRAQACTLEPIPEHAASWRALRKEPAAHIAALTGTTEPPTESSLCLGCHTSGADLGSRWWQTSFDNREGVQCEGCHGPGSDHVRARRAGTPGEVPPPLGIRKGERSFCDDCHRPRPSHDLVLAKSWRLAPEDREYKTPVNLAVAPDGRRLFVVGEHSNSLLVLDVASGALVREIPVGQRPHDVALSPDGSRVYVSNRFSHSVTVIDGASFERVGEVPVGDDPHGLVVSPSGADVFVVDTGEDAISVVDARSLTESRRLVAGRAPWSLALRADGRSLVATSLRPLSAPFRTEPRSELTEIALGANVARARPAVEGATMMMGIAAVPGRDVLLFTLTRPKNLVPITRLAQGWVETFGLGVLWPDGRVDQLLLDEPGRAFPDPEDVAVSPDGRFAVVSSGGADELALVDVERLLHTLESSSDEQRARVLPNHLGRSAEFVLRRLHVGANPRGLVFAPNGRELYVAEALEDAVAVVSMPEFTLTRRLDLGGPRVTTELREGERLFHDATVTQGRQLSCRTCHPDGHIDGLAFDIEADGLGLHPVDNRSLRGIFDTPPFKWEGTNPSLERQCGPRFAVFFTRLDPFTPDELAALVRYLSTIERPPNPHRAADGLTPRQRRGKAVFERARANDGDELPLEKRCTTCHGSAYHESGAVQDVGTTMWFDAAMEVEDPDLEDESDFGPMGIALYQDVLDLARRFDTPMLRNVYASPPYLHNGAVRTLEEIWTRFNLYQGHGMTHDLTRGQLNDLVAYLKAL
ncbi:MAG: beta-propeller fold lactonase family protein [Planctomycetes bacterium]|nr:beta-propeller fold lactonase family protein [Planctomycetota bacterium]